jgi:hypothetical protein
MFVLADLDHANPKLRGALKDWLCCVNRDLKHASSVCSCRS